MDCFQLQDLIHPCIHVEPKARHDTEKMDGHHAEEKADLRISASAADDRMQIALGRSRVATPARPVLSYI